MDFFSSKSAVKKTASESEQVRTLQQLFRTKCEEVEDVNESLRMTKTSLAEKAAECEDFRAENERLRSQVAALTDDLTAAKSEAARREADGLELRRRLEASLEECREREALLASSVEKLRTDVETRAEAIEAKERRLSILKGQMLMSEQSAEIGKLHIKQLQTLLSSPSTPYKTPTKGGFVTTPTTR